MFSFSPVKFEPSLKIRRVSNIDNNVKDDKKGKRNINNLLYKYTVLK